MRVRTWRPYVLVAMALALPLLHAQAGTAAIGPRERAALLELFATDAALARAREQAGQARARLTRAQADLRSLRGRVAVARSNQRASQRALARRLDEIYRTQPLDMLGVLLAARSWSDVDEGADLLDRLARADGELVRSARRWDRALRGQARTLRATAGRAQAEQRAWEARAGALEGARAAERALIERLRREQVRAVTALAARARRDAARARTITRPPALRDEGAATTTPQTPAQAPQAPPAPPPAPAQPSLAAGTALSVHATAYSLPGRTASGLPVGQGICATDPRTIPLGTRFEIPGYGTCVAADTGSAVIGATIDIWMPAADAAAYGTQTITITFR